MMCWMKFFESKIQEKKLGVEVWGRNGSKIGQIDQKKIFWEKKTTIVIICEDKQ